MRSVFSGRTLQRTLHNRAGDTQPCEQRPCMTVNDPDAVLRGVLMHMGVGLLPMPHIFRQLENGSLLRLLPDWLEHAGTISLHFSGQKSLPAKTRAFVDFVLEQFREQDLAQRFLAA